MGKGYSKLVFFNNNNNIVEITLLYITDNKVADVTSCKIFAYKIIKWNRPYKAMTISLLYISHQQW